MEVLQKTNNRTTHDMAISVQGTYPEEVKLICQRNICTPVFIIALFVIAKIWDPLKFLSMDKCIKII
jgi:hypothetical protein